MEQLFQHLHYSGTLSPSRGSNVNIERGYKMKRTVNFYPVFALLFVCALYANSHAQQKNTEVPVDCPLKKQGVNAHDMKPFEDVKKYIDFLERKDRDEWQKPGKVISAINLKGNEVLADIGAGSGYFTFRLLTMLPRGKVIAIDAEPGMVRHIHHKVKTAGIRNIEVLLASYDDPHAPKAADIVFVCDVLHHVKKRDEWVSKLYKEMKPSSKLVLIEFKEGSIPEGPPASLKISSKEMLSLLTNAGFTLIKHDMQLLPYQNYFEFLRNE